MARVFSWKITQGGRTGYAYISKDGFLSDVRITGDELERLAQTAYAYTKDEYASRFYQMQMVADDAYGKDGVIPGRYTDYIGDAVNTIMLTGKDGSDGENGFDARSVEYCYRRFATTESFSEYLRSWVDGATMPSVSSEGAVPTGWFPIPYGVDGNSWMVEAVSQRIVSREGYGKWSKPSVWSKWGIDGKDGNGVEYIYYLTSDMTMRPSLYVGGTASDYYKKDGSSVNVVDDEYQTDDFLPYEKNGSAYVQWADNILEPTQENKALWVSTRKKEAGKWGNFSEPSLWSKYVTDGKDGRDGHTVTVYFTNPSVDIFPSGDNPSVFDYSDAVSDIVFMDGTEEVFSGSLSSYVFDGYVAGPVAGDGTRKRFSNADASIVFDVVFSESQRSRIEMVSLTSPGRARIVMSITIGANADSAMFEAELDCDGRIELVADRNSFRFRGNASGTPEDRSPITVKSVYYRGFTTLNTWWETCVDGVWGIIAENRATSDVLKIAYDDVLWNGLNELYLRKHGQILSADGGVLEDDYDSMTLYRFYDGKDGRDGVDGINGTDGINGYGLTAVLSNPSCDVFPKEDGTLSYAEAATQITLYNNSTAVDGFGAAVRGQNWNEDATTSGLYHYIYGTTEMSVIVSGTELRVSSMSMEGSGSVTVPVLISYGAIGIVTPWVVHMDLDGNRITLTASETAFLQSADGTYAPGKITVTPSFVGIYNASNTVWLVKGFGDEEFVELKGSSYEKDGIANLNNEGAVEITAEAWREDNENTADSITLALKGNVTDDSDNVIASDVDYVTVYSLPHGEKGADSVTDEHIYLLSVSGEIDDEQKPQKWDTASNEYQKNGYHGPESSKWTDHAQSITPAYRYEYISSRKYDSRELKWGAFSEPVLWSRWGEDGTDGDGVQYSYFVTSDSTAPQLDPYDTGSTEYQERLGNFLPSTDGVKWTDKPSGVSQENRYEWCVTRRRQNGVWNELSAPIVWAYYPKDGAKGETGAVYRYVGEYNPAAEVYTRNSAIVDYVSYGYEEVDGVPMLKYWFLRSEGEYDGATAGVPGERESLWEDFMTAQCIATDFVLSNQITTHILEATSAKFDEVSATTVNASKAYASEINGITMEYVNAKIGDLDVNNITAKSVESASEVSGVTRTAVMNSETFELSYGDSKIYLGILDDYKLEGQSGATRVPVLCLSYGGETFYIDPSIWKNLNQTIITYDWNPITMYQSRDCNYLSNSVVVWQCRIVNSEGSSTIVKSTAQLNGYEGTAFTSPYGLVFSEKPTGTDLSPRAENLLTNRTNMYIDGVDASSSFYSLPFMSSLKSFSNTDFTDFGLTSSPNTYGNVYAAGYVNYEIGSTDNHEQACLFHVNFQTMSFNNGVISTASDTKDSNYIGLRGINYQNRMPDNWRLFSTDIDINTTGEYSLSKLIAIESWAMDSPNAMFTFTTNKSSYGNNDWTTYFSYTSSDGGGKIGFARFDKKFTWKILYNKDKNFKLYRDSVSTGPSRIALTTGGLQETTIYY